MSIISKITDALGGKGGGDMVPQKGGGGLPARRPSSAYMRGGRNVLFKSWRPTLRDAQVDVSEAWTDAAARAVEVIQNSGWLAGMIEQAVANTVGTGLRLKAMPENSLFGMSSADARAWGRDVEAKFELWANSPQECDIRGMFKLSQMQEQAFHSWISMGEILSELPVKRRPWNVHSTKVRMLSPHRISRECNSMKRLINGVYTNRDGMPVGYRAIKTDPFWGRVEYDVRARDRYGRQRVVHVFTGPVETYRGIGPLTPVLQVTRQFDQFSDATLTSAIVQTLFAATVTGDAPTEEVMQGLLTPKEQMEMARDGISPVEAYLEMLGGYYDGGLIDLGMNGRVAHLFPGQELEFHKPQGVGPDHKSFVKTLLMEIARCLGMTYQSATGDFEGSSYATLNNATAEIYGVTRKRRNNILVPFLQPIYEAWLEEQIITGRVNFPGGYGAFMANKAAACRSEWRGPPRPEGDALKQAKAHQVWEQMGVMSHEMIANEIGVDIEDVYDQRAREAELRKELDLPEPVAAQAAAQSTGDDSQDDDKGDADGGDA